MTSRVGGVARDLACVYEESRPEITVIIPVHNGGSCLHQCLGVLTKRSSVSAEIIVVDDASTDDSRTIAEKFGVTVLSNERPLGPAAARNLAARSAMGSILLFVDADVEVSPETLSMVAATFSSRPDVAALFGSYDDRPLCKNFVSQYKNLMHHYIHQVSNPDAVTFWTGLGAVRRDVFLSLGGFDEQRYRYPAIEDVELGYRLKGAGHKILLDKKLQGKHLKRWTLRSLIEVDILRRAIPWTQLMVETGHLPKDLNFRGSDRLSAGLVTVLTILAPILVAMFWHSGDQREFLLAAWLLLLCIVLFLNRQAYRFLWSRKGWFFASVAVPLHLLYYLYSVIAFATSCGFLYCRTLFTPGHRQQSMFAARSSSLAGMHPSSTFAVSSSHSVSTAPSTILAGDVRNAISSCGNEVRGETTIDDESLRLLSEKAKLPIPLLGHAARPLLLTFAPLHKRALGISVGIVFGASIFLATSFLLLRYHGSRSGANLGLLAQFFAWYSVSWTGALVGAFWGTVLGYVIGWGFAFWRNFIMALYFFYIKAGLEMKRYADFLSHV